MSYFRGTKICRMPIPEAGLSELMRSRRAVFPKAYRPDQPVSREIIEQLLENANWAPTHKRTEPWRFQVFHSADSRARLGDYLAEYYHLHTAPDAFSTEKMKKNAENPRLAGAVLAIILHRDPAERLPEFEEVAAVAMAVQNIWLSCAAMGLGAYWSTPQAALDAGAFLELAPNERCLGLFYLGWPAQPALPGQRGPIAEKVIWR